MAEQKNIRDFQTYEEVAVYLINRFAKEFGIDLASGKELVPGKSGTTWELDGQATNEDGSIVLIIECKRYTTSRVNQETVGGLAFRIVDTGASGGILVSPLGLQSGAAIVASSQNIIPVRLDPNSTTTEYMLQFLNKCMVGLSDTITLKESLKITVKRADGSIETHEY